MATIIREQLHRIIDLLPESELKTAKRWLEQLGMVRGVPAELTDAAEETETLAPDELAALATAETEVKRGELVPDSEFDAALAQARRARQSRH